MKVLWLTNIPSPYRVDFFNELGKHCELTVLFERLSSAERNRKWQADSFVNFTGVILTGINIGVDKGICFSVGKWLKKNTFDRIVVSNVATPTGMLAIKIMQLQGIAFMIEGDGGFAKTGKGLKEQVKKHFIKSAQYWLSTGNTHTNYYLTYGAQKENIYVYPFTSLQEKDVMPSILHRDEKQKLKGKLGIAEEIAIISVGRFIPGKGFDILLNAARHIPDHWGIYIIGGEPTLEYLDFKKEYKLSNVHFLGFKNKEELKEYYKAGDLFVLPTRGDVWGLVINEAMACGLPIITTDKCVAGLELVTADNGILVPVEDVAALVSGIHHILSDENLMKDMAEKSLATIKPYTIENMARVHMKVFKDVVEENTRVV